MTKAMPEDLLNAVIAADDLRRKAKGMTSTRAALGVGTTTHSWERRVIEPAFNLIGHLWAFGMTLMPAPARRPFVQWVNTKMGKYAPVDNPALRPRIDETVRMAQELQKKTGQWPVLLVMTSHPDTEGPHQWLRFEVLRQGLQIADAVVEARAPGAWYPVHPRCFLAIDPYALDTVSPLMSPDSIPPGCTAFTSPGTASLRRNPGFERNLLLRHSNYPKIAWKLLKLLKSGTPVLMAMGGGLPYNARLLYAAREFVQRLPVKRWTVSKRKAQLQLMDILMKSDGDVWPAERGEIPLGHERKIREQLSAWGLASDRADAAIEELRVEFKRIVPYRERLLRVLAHHFSSRGQPVILIAIAHSETAPHVRIGAPVTLPDHLQDIPAFARRFGTENF